MFVAEKSTRILKKIRVDVHAFRKKNQNTRLIIYLKS